MRNSFVIYKETLLKNYPDQIIHSSRSSILINTILSFGKLILGLISGSIWFDANAIYSLILCIAKTQVLFKYNSLFIDPNNQNQYHLQQLHIFKKSGIFVLLTSISYFFVCLIMYIYKAHNAYPYYIVYGITAIAFYKVFTAIKGLTISMKVKNPITTTLQIFSFIDAMVSIVFVQCALIEMKNGINSAILSSSLFGMVCSLVFMFIGLKMLFIPLIPFSES
ncbi:hypothetical protein [Anaerorhabdus sp.]|uniref:hypothetical protein n=1 Tax=Anaerorhabdus sp. TaxID=1872524 RepID=UPI002FCB2544